MIKKCNCKNDGKRFVKNANTPTVYSKHVYCLIEVVQNWLRLDHFFTKQILNFIPNNQQVANTPGK